MVSGADMLLPHTKEGLRELRFKLFLCLMLEGERGNQK
jgi:hypothetical protein